MTSRRSKSPAAARKPLPSWLQEEAKDGQGTSGEQENKEVDKVVDKEVEKSKPSGEKRKSCEERGEGSRRSTGTDR